MPNSTAPGHLRKIFSHDVASLVGLQQNKRVIRIHRSTIAKPAYAAVSNQFMHAALDVDAEHIEEKNRVRPGIFPSDCSATRHDLSVNDIVQNHLARSVHNNFVRNEQVCLLRIKAFWPMYALEALRPAWVESKCLVGWL